MFDNEMFVFNILARIIFALNYVTKNIILQKYTSIKNKSEMLFMTFAI